MNKIVLLNKHQPYIRNTPRALAGNGLVPRTHFVIRLSKIQNEFICQYIMPSLIKLDVYII